MHVYIIGEVLLDKCHLIDLESLLKQIQTACKGERKLEVIPGSIALLAGRLKVSLMEGPLCSYGHVSWYTYIRHI